MGREERSGATVQKLNLLWLLLNAFDNVRSCDRPDRIHTQRRRLCRATGCCRVSIAGLPSFCMYCRNLWNLELNSVLEVRV